MRTAPLIEAIDIGQVLAQRMEIKVANAAVEEAQAKSRLQDVSARPDLNILYGYKEPSWLTRPPGEHCNCGPANYASRHQTRNQGNRAAAAAEVLRQQELLAATEAESARGLLRRSYKNIN